jgi:hypothetical protein
MYVCMDVCMCVSLVLSVSVSLSLSLSFSLSLSLCLCMLTVLGACGCEFCTLKSINTFVRQFFSFFGSDSKSSRTSFAGYSSRIPDYIVYFVIQPESKDIRNSFAGGIYPIPDDI